MALDSRFRGERRREGGLLVSFVFCFWRLGWGIGTELVGMVERVLATRFFWA